MISYFYLKDFDDKAFADGSEINHEELANNVHTELINLDPDDFETLLVTAGYIPDQYPNDSSEETLYTKFIEALVCAWANRIGIHAEMVKTKGSREDVTITIDNRIVVCDAKSFRLGRSQGAPNAKDFLKLEDIRKWMNNFDNSIGGLVTYPCKHEWSTSSDVYQYCSTLDAPTVMLPYELLAFIFHYRDEFNPIDLLNLWDYKKLFPKKLPKSLKGGNKVAYWNTMHKAVAELTHQTEKVLSDYLESAHDEIDKMILCQIKSIENSIHVIEEDVEKRISALDEKEVKHELVEFMTKTETGPYKKLVDRIYKFRL